MKKTILTLILVICFVSKKLAQERPLKNGLAIGYQLAQYQNDFGFGLNFTSPFYFGQNVGFRLKSNVMFLQHIDASGFTTWTPYANVSLGMIGIGGMVSENIRLYGEGGLLVLFPSARFSSQSAQVGGYGLFGFEFFLSKGFNYFIEIGGVGIGALADKVPHQPIYSNGLSV